MKIDHANTYIKYTCLSRDKVIEKKHSENKRKDTKY